MGGVGQAFGIRGLRSIQNGGRPELEVLLAILAEFQRAGGAERRHEQLTRASAAALARDGIVRTDLPRRIFKEFYSLSHGAAEDTWL